jgi:hypothetical protein
MEETLTQIYVYGFSPDELDHWERDLGLQPVTLEPGALGTLQEGLPVVVHASEAADLTHRIESEGAAVEIILYLPSGAQKPRGAYYDAVITQDELPSLRALVTYPEQFRMRRLAEDVPLRLLTKPIQTLDLQELGLPENDATHLVKCPVCPAVLREALRDRVRLYQRLSCPSPEELILYVRTGKVAGGQFSEHMQTCPLCEAQLQALRAVMKPGVAESKVLIEVPAISLLGRTLGQAVRNVQQEIEDLRGGLQAAFGILLDLFDGVWAGTAGWQIAGVRNLKDLEANTSNDPEIEREWLSILQEVYDEQIPVILTRGRAQIYLGWDIEEGAPYLEMPGGSTRAAKEFNVEIRSAQTSSPVWSTRSQQRRMVLPPDVVARELDTYEAMHGSPGDSPYNLVILEES